MIDIWFTFQLAHLALLASFPFFSVTSPSFIVAVIMVLVNHYFAFSYFGENYYPFSEVSGAKILEILYFNRLYLAGDGVFHHLHVAGAICLLRLFVS